MIVDNVAYINSNVASNINVVEVLTSTCNIVQDQHVISNLIVDGISYINSNVVSNINVIEVLTSTSNIVQDEHVKNNLIVDNVAYINSNVVSNINVIEVLTSISNIVDNEHIKNNLVVDHVASINSNVVSNINVIEILTSTCNIVDNEYIVNNLVVDGISYMNCNVVSNIDIKNVLRSTCNIVENVSINNNLDVIGTITSDSNIVNFIQSKREISANVIKCNRLDILDPSGFEVTPSNKYDSLLTDTFIEIDFNIKNTVADTTLYDIDNNFDTSLVFKEFFNPLTELSCSGTCNFSVDYISMLLHENNIFRYDPSLNKSIELDDAYLEKTALSTDIRNNKFTLFSWVKLSNTKQIGEIFNIGNIILKRENIKLILTLDSTDNIINNFFSDLYRLNEWISFVIVHEDNNIYVYCDFQLIFSVAHILNISSNPTLKVNSNFSQNGSYNKYDCVLLWNTNKLKDDIKSFLLLYKVPIFYTSDGISSKNEVSYDEYDKRVNDILSLRNILQVNPNKINIDTCVNILTKYTNKPYGSLIVNDISYDLQQCS